MTMKHYLARIAESTSLMMQINVPIVGNTSLQPTLGNKHQHGSLS